MGIVMLLCGNITIDKKEATMIQLWVWEYEGKTWLGTKDDVEPINLYGTQIDFPFGKSSWFAEKDVTNLRKVKVVDEDCQDESHLFVNDTCKYCGQKLPINKTYLTTKQFIKVWKSLDDDKRKELDTFSYVNWNPNWNEAWIAARRAFWSAGWYEAWYEAWCAEWSAARYADLAIVARDKITPNQFNTLVHPWTSCGLSLYSEDWEQVLTPPVTEPKNFGAIVEAEYIDWKNDKVKTRFTFSGIWWINEKFGNRFKWEFLINPSIISEGVEG